MPATVSSSCNRQRTWYNLPMSVSNIGKLRQLLRNLIASKLTAYAPVIVGTCASLIIVANALGSDSGFLSPDSTNYLRLVETLRSGQGFFVPNDGRGVAQDAFFAVWPVGYPAAIFALSSITGLDAFWASKALNILVYLSTILVVLAYFGRNGRLLVLVLLFGSYLAIFSFTWSEGPFILLLLALALATNRAMSQSGFLFVASVAWMSALIGALFLTRYVGLVGAVALLIVFVDRVRKRDRWSAALVVAMGLSVILVTGAYLSLNIELTGYATGSARVPSFESSSELAVQLIKAVVHEAIFPVAFWSPSSVIQGSVVFVQFLLISVLGVFAIRAKRHVLARQDEVVMFVIGAVYLLTIISLRWVSAFDDYNYRLLAPGTLLVLLPTFSLLLRSTQKLKSLTVLLLTYSALASTTLHVHGRLTEAGSYDQATQQRLERYSSLPTGAIVVFGEPHVKYLRPDIHVAYPFGNRYVYDPSTQEPWAAFIESLDPSRDVYLEVSSRALWTLSSSQYSESVGEAIAQHQHAEGAIVHID